MLREISMYYLKIVFVRKKVLAMGEKKTNDYSCFLDYTCNII